MLYDALMIVLITLVIMIMSIAGNRLGLWNSWLMCLAGGFTAGLLVCTQTALPAEENGILAGAVTVALAALLRWLNAENLTPTPSTTATYANDQPTIDDVFEFEEV